MGEADRCIRRRTRNPADRHRPTGTLHAAHKKRCTQESPVEAEMLLLTRGRGGRGGD